MLRGAGIWAPERSHGSHPVQGLWGAELVAGGRGEHPRPLLGRVRAAGQARGVEAGQGETEGGLIPASEGLFSAATWDGTGSNGLLLQLGQLRLEGSGKLRSQQAGPAVSNAWPGSARGCRARGAPGGLGIAGQGTEPAGGTCRWLWGGAHAPRLRPCSTPPGLRKSLAISALPSGPLPGPGAASVSVREGKLSRDRGPLFSPGVAWAATPCRSRAGRWGPDRAASREEGGGTPKGCGGLGAPSTRN